MKPSDIDLGPCLGVYKGRPLAKKEVAFIISSLTIFSISPFLLGFYRALYGYANYGPAASFSWGIPFITISIGSFFLILLYSLNRLIAANTSVSLHKSGILLQRFRKKGQFLRWEDIRALYVTNQQMEDKGDSYQMKAIIHYAENNRLLLKDSMVDRLPELITQVKSSVYIHLYPILREKFRAGELISFGPVDIQKNYIRIRKYGFKSQSLKISWKDINQITIKSGFLLIGLHNKEIYRISIAEIPNIEILLRTIEDNTRV